jgi:hypothetical protein
MPNWFHNSMTVTGAADEILRFKQTCLRNDSLDLNIEWHACRFRLWVDEPERFQCGFDTAWGPPVEVWEKMGKLFPALEFSLSGCEPMNDYAFVGEMHNGVMELRDTPMIWKTTDPKTGEAVSGTRAEIEAWMAAKETQWTKPQ